MFGRICWADNFIKMTLPIFFCLESFPVNFGCCSKAFRTKKCIFVDGLLPENSQICGGQVMLGHHQPSDFLGHVWSESMVI